MQIVYTTSNFKGGIYRAVLAILLGLALLIWPADALKYVVMLIGIVFLAHKAAVRNVESEPLRDA